MNDNNFKKDENYSNQDIKDDWDSADNDWQKNKLFKNVFLIYNGINSFFYGRKFRQK